MRNFKRTAMALSALIVLLVNGCSESRGQLPEELINADKPLTLESKSEEGVIISDARGKYYFYAENYYFAQNIISSSLKSGDTLGN